MFRPAPALLSFSLCLALSGCPAGSATECQQDGDCPAGRFCTAAGECIYVCTYDSDCPPSNRCDERGRCQTDCDPSNGGQEACDGIDNDCDGQTDEGFADLGQPCDSQPCAGGAWICAGDGQGLTCQGPDPDDDDASCDGRDDDCDGATDEDALAQDCPLQAGVCAGATQQCQAGAWTACDYGPHHSPAGDDSCDQRDNDCDGATDEDAASLLAAEFGAAAVDGLDNNCNGLVDEPGGVMVALDAQVAVDAFELAVFATPECGGQRYGQGLDDYPLDFPVDVAATDQLFACSLPGLIPSGHLSWHRAQAVCQAQGKRLCSANEYRRACAGPEQNLYPYGSIFIAGACNDGWAAASQPAVGGAYPYCLSGSGAFDMSGNFAEWVADWSDDYPGAAAMAAAYWGCRFCHLGTGCWACGEGGDDQHLIMAMSDCTPEPQRLYESAPRDMAQAHFGARCCLDRN